MRFVTVATVLVVAAILGSAAVDKLLHWDMFVTLLEQNPLVPEHGAAAVAGGTIAAEVTLAAGVLVVPSRRSALFWAGMLFAIFSAVTAYLAAAAPGTPCGCWFVFDYARADILHLLQNLLCLALCLYVWCTGSFCSQPARETHGRNPAGGSRSLISLIRRNP